MNSGCKELDISLETMHMKPVQNDRSHQSTDKLNSCPASPTECCETTSEEDPRHQTDIGQNLLQDKLKDGKLSLTTNTSKSDISLILLSNKVFDDDMPPSEWTSRLQGRPLTFSESINLRHEMSGHIINPAKDYRFAQCNKSTAKSQHHPTARGACVPKSAPHCSKGTSKTTENINQTPKTSDTKSDGIISIIPVGDTKEWEVTSQDPVRPRQSSTSRGQGGRKEGATDKPKTVGQSGDHRKAVYAFAEAFPPAARKLNIQALGRSEKNWRELEATVRCYRVKEERLIMRLLRLERLQNLTIEAERKRTNSANSIKRPKPNGVLEVHNRPSSDQPTADRKPRTSVASSRPASAYSCRESAHQRKESLADAADRKGAADGYARSNELNTGRALHRVSTRPNVRYAWLSP